MDFQMTVLAQKIVVRRVVTVHYFEYTKDFFFPGESHDFWEFLYVDKGEVSVTAGGRVADLPRGGIIFHKPLEFHSLRANGEVAPNLAVVSFDCHSPAMRGFEGQIFQLDDDARDCVARIIAEAENAFLPPLDDPTTKGLCRREHEGAFAAEQMLCLALEQLLITLLRGSRGGARKPTTAFSEIGGQKLVDQIILYMEQNRHRRLTVDSICHDNLIGRSRLQKLFRQKMGMGVIDCFRRIKIESAKQKIREGQRNITEISEQLGYSSIAYFSMDFKKITGMSPTEYGASVKSRNRWG